MKFETVIESKTQKQKDCPNKNLINVGADLISLSFSTFLPFLLGVMLFNTKNLIYLFFFMLLLFFDVRVSYDNNNDKIIIKILRGV